MAKLRLDPDTLDVQSFEIVDGGRARGTVRALATGFTDGCASWENGCSNEETCTGGRFTELPLTCPSYYYEPCPMPLPKQISDPVDPL